MPVETVLCRVPVEPVEAEWLTACAWATVEYMYMYSCRAVSRAVEFLSSFSVEAVEFIFTVECAVELEPGMYLACSFAILHEAL
jgi:hypothetical protein